ncbi:hypothetical protein J5U18_01185 [Sphingobacteriaceae bacterium WQ 2009]|uniref:Uncharacterized protein n=1 Tax=Rhinopithecimicrobium faecis TaxID=2820698 RepID=A0A8T4H4U8_9SPHI|nr:hypothetical protein [Sphingobacteriaceae bacterium WQ 2009]
MENFKKYFFLIIYFNLIFFNSFSQKSAFFSAKSSFDNEISKDRIFTKKLILADDSWAIYKLSASLDAYNNMYLATKDEKYLLEGMDIIKSIINNSQSSIKIKNSQFKDNYKTWVNKSHPDKGNDSKEYPLYETFFWRYVTTQLVLIKDNGLDKKYKSYYKQVLNFSEKNIFEKWHKRGDKNIYRENTNMSALWSHVCFNLYIITRKNDYLNVCKNFNSKFLKQLKYNSDGTVFWNSFWDARKKTKQGQDVSHANAEVSYIIDCYSRGYFFDLNLINSISKTFTTRILKDNNSTAYYLDGSGDSKGRIVDGFLKLGRFDKNLAQRLTSFYPPNESEFYRNIQYYSVMALINK